MYTSIIPYPGNDYCTYSNQTGIISRRIARKYYNILSWNTSQQERHSATSVASGLLLLGCSILRLFECILTNTSTIKKENRPVTKESWNGDNEEILLLRDVDINPKQILVIVFGFFFHTPPRTIRSRSFPCSRLFLHEWFSIRSPIKPTCTSAFILSIASNIFVQFGESSRALFFQ